MLDRKEKKVTPRPKRPVYKPPFVKQWREYRNMTQERLAELVGEYLGKSYTHASIGRIENGKMPYTQPVLEAMADALGTDCASLLIRDPTQPEAIWTLWERALPAERTTIAEHAEFIVSKRRAR